MVLAAGPPPNAASGISLESMPHLTAEILKILNPVEIHPALLNLGTSPNHDHGYIFRVMGEKKIYRNDRTVGWAFHLTAPAEF